MKTQKGTVIPIYKVELSETKQNILVKESCVNVEENVISTPQSAVSVMNEAFQLQKAAEEKFCILALDGANHPLGVFEVAHGTINSCVISTRNIFIRLLLSGAGAFIAAHNHPSGTIKPSKEDLAVYQKIKDASELMDIAFLDNLIISSAGTFCSFREDGI